METGGDLLFRAVSSQVPSALKGLTSVFGMGTGDPLRHCRRKFLGCAWPFPRGLWTLRSSPACGHFLRPLTTAHRMNEQACPFAFWSQPRLSFGLRFRFAPSCLVSLNQALGLLVPASSMHCCASTAGLSPGRLPGALLPFRNGNLLLEVGFTLRCLQRLSCPYFASLLCAWQRNSCTSGASTPVLSY